MFNAERQFSEIVTHTNGFFARDDLRKEIVLVFRGSDANTLADYFTGALPQPTSKRTSHLTAI